MGTLERLARNKFPDPPLSAAEERVVRAASDGTEADCRDLGGGDDLAKPEKWPAPRSVRAELIRWLCVDREARELVDPRGIQIQGARITGELDLSFTNVLFPLVLFRCRLEQDLVLRYAKMPLLSLEGSWTKKISADSLNVEGGLFLTNGFHAEGEVSLTGATIGGNLEADGGTFKNSNGDALSAAGIKVTGSVFLRNGFTAEGTVRLRVAEVNGQLEVYDARLDALDFEAAHITGPFFWQNIPKDPERRVPYLNLTNAKVGSLVDQEASWPEEGRLRLDGFVYGRILARPIDAEATEPRVPIDATARLRWLGLQPKDDGYLPQPYEQLIAVLRQMGHEDQVAEIAIAKQKDLYEHGDLGWWGWIRSWVLYLAVGYGYEPWRAFLGMAALVIVGTLVFSVARFPSVRVMVPSDKEAYESDQTVKTPLPYYYPQFNAVVYSLDVIFPFDLGQKSHWRLSERWSCDFLYWIFELYSLFQLFVGWVLLLVAAAVPAGFIKKD